MRVSYANSLLAGLDCARPARVTAANAEVSAFFDTIYCNQLRYTKMADERQVFCNVSATQDSGKAARSSSRGRDRAFSRKSLRSLVAAKSKYPCGIVGYVSLSRLRNLFMSLRYSLSRVRALYSGWPWKWTNRLPFFFFTNKSTPASADLVSTTSPRASSACSRTSFHRECGNRSW